MTPGILLSLEQTGQINLFLIDANEQTECLVPFCSLPISCTCTRWAWKETSINFSIIFQSVISIAFPFVLRNCCFTENTLMLESSLENFYIVASEIPYINGHSTLNLFSIKVLNYLFTNLCIFHSVSRNFKIYSGYK